ncbi:Molecular chaperone (DnaJ superfamily) [Ceraceosorus bombacis]|uniref:Molecular chaperone (DnaJ superfamily) n=1 Tax=Ceraceosorus bombacis TaxID=401625 RepID=A0A0P1B7G4_9BASI|nr:Molecular chaperone (DnaJ superfamily) [Ceraceosorus bombacis]
MSGSSEQCPYQVLGVGPDSTPRDIKAAYRARALQTHPDRAEPHRRASSEEHFKVILRPPAPPPMSGFQTFAWPNQMPAWAPPPSEPPPNFLSRMDTSTKPPAPAFQDLRFGHQPYDEATTLGQPLRPPLHSAFDPDHFYDPSFSGSGKESRQDDWVHPSRFASATLTGMRRDDGLVFDGSAFNMGNRLRFTSAALWQKLNMSGRPEAKGKCMARGAVGKTAPGCGAGVPLPERNEGTWGPWHREKSGIGIGFA